MNIQVHIDGVLVIEAVTVDRSSTPAHAASTDRGDGLAWVGWAPKGDDYRWDVYSRMNAKTKDNTASLEAIVLELQRMMCV